MSDDSNNPESSNAIPGHREVNELLHEGEIEAQKRFGVEGFWNTHNLNAMLHDTISPNLAGFIESLPFFFIATANAKGECDCSFRGREHDVSGCPYPLVKVIDKKTLVFPDYRGNKLYNSLGNIIVNGHIGILFINVQKWVFYSFFRRYCINCPDRSTRRVKWRSRTSSPEPMFTKWPTGSTALAHR